MLIKCTVGVDILYYPKRSLLLQSFYWQTEDVVPEIPRIKKFLDFWRRELDATISQINIIPFREGVKFQNGKFYGEFSSKQSH